MRLSVARHVSNFQFAKVSVEPILPRSCLGVTRHAEVVDQEGGAAETQTAPFDSRPDTLVYAADEINSLVAPEQAHVLVFHISGIDFGRRQRRIVGLRRLI